MSESKQTERAVMADVRRPCLYGVAGPCFHPACLESHFKTLETQIAAAKSYGIGGIGEPMFCDHWDGRQ